MNRLFTAIEVEQIVRDTFRCGEIIEFDPTSGYDIKQDLGWTMRFRLIKDGYDRICYIFCIDLARSSRDLESHLREGWELASARANWRRFERTYGLCAPEYS